MTTHMTAPLASSAVNAKRPLRSTLAVLLGFISVVALSLGTDQVLHVLQVYPPWGELMHDPWLNLLALGYRSIYTIVGGYITARLAPRNPMRHVLALAGVGFIAGVAGIVATVPLNLGPAWYPVALALTGPLFAWLGGSLHAGRSA